MSLILTNTVKLKFPTWDDFLSDLAEQAEVTSEEMLEDVIADAETLFKRYVDVSTSDDMTDDYNFHLLRLIRYEAFQRKHGDSEFKEAETPRIVKDYLETIDLLKRGVIGWSPDINQHDRLFGPSTNIN